MISSWYQIICFKICAYLQQQAVLYIPCCFMSTKDLKILWKAVENLFTHFLLKKINFPDFLSSSLYSKIFKAKNIELSKQSRSALIHSFSNGPKEKTSLATYFYLKKIWRVNLYFSKKRNLELVPGLVFYSFYSHYQENEFG